jgi:2-phospho-L-lactate guanylyltransferase (CobY/MobA/RfbA family)
MKTIQGAQLGESSVARNAQDGLDPISVSGNINSIDGDSLSVYLKHLDTEKVELLVVNADYTYDAANGVISLIDVTLTVDDLDEDGNQQFENGVLITKQVSKFNIDDTVIYKNTPGFSQPANFLDSRGFDVTVVEKVLDKAFLAIASLQEIIDRCFKFPISERNENTDMVTPEERKNTVLGFDDSGVFKNRTDFEVTTDAVKEAIINEDIPGQASDAVNDEVGSQEFEDKVNTTVASIVDTEISGELAAANVAITTATTAATNTATTTITDATTVATEAITTATTTAVETVEDSVDTAITNAGIPALAEEQVGVVIPDLADTALDAAIANKTIALQFKARPMGASILDTAYTFALTDADTLILAGNDTTPVADQIFTIPADTGTDDFEIGTEIEVIQRGNYNVIVVGANEGGGTDAVFIKTPGGTKTFVKYSSFVIKKLAETSGNNSEWLFIG